FGFVGIDASSSNNLALVTGSASVWSNALDLYVGNSASRNQLVVSNGGTVFTGAKAVLSGNGGARSNSASVTGIGSKWVVFSDLYVGSNGGFSLLVVDNAALVQNHSGLIGLASSSSNNVAVVTGSGTMWNSTGDLIVGASGSGNLLVV